MPQADLVIVGTEHDDRRLRADSLGIAPDEAVEDHLIHDK